MSIATVAITAAGGFLLFKNWRELMNIDLSLGDIDED